MSHPSSSLNGVQVPWQLWAVIALLAVEGVGNALQMFAVPMAAVWLAAKVLFFVGFIRRWRPVYVLFIVLSALHVIGFAASAPIIALLNLVLLLLVASQYRWFFSPGSARMMVTNHQAG